MSAGGFVHHPRVPRDKMAGRKHPTKGYQWWHGGRLWWRCDIPMLCDVVLSWEDTWCEPEAED